MSLNKKSENNLIAYFKYFSNKDIKKLETLFSNHIRIIDWSSNIFGKKSALAFNKKLFSKFKTIKVILIEKFFNNKNKSFACKISIKLNNKTINVVDLIYFDSKNRISKIIAYLR